ncbi:transposase [Rivihabitans pingtungensis]|uniref:transposase n=1 Tax=Rivihabitans pingtungensis TaxID=1054498 RepID=UPI003570DEF8
MGVRRTVPDPVSSGRRVTQTSLREVCNAVRYVVRCGYSWRMLPNDLPPWLLVYQQMQRWLKSGCFEEWCMTCGCCCGYR